MSVVRVTSLLFYFSFADLLFFSLPALILWEFFLRHSLDQAFVLRFLWLFLMLLCRKTSSSSFWVSCGTHCHGLWKLPHWWLLCWQMDKYGDLSFLFGSCFEVIIGFVLFVLFVFSLLLHFWLWLQFCVKYISRASHQIGRIFWGSYSCWLWTLL
jgi:hypothetical protein